MGSNSMRVYEFSSFRLYPDQKLLYCNTERLKIDRKALEVLEVLVRHKGQLVTKEHLLEEAWHDSNVEEGNINVQVSRIRKALGDEKKPFKYVETVHGEGYRFIGDVSERLEDLYPEDPKPRRWRLALVAAVAAVLFLSAIAFWFWKAKSPVGKADSAVMIGPTTPDALSRYKLALQYELNGDDEQAIAALDEAIGLDRQFTDAYIYAAFIYNQLGKEDEALKYLGLAQSSGRAKNDHQQLQIDALEAELNDSYAEAFKRYRLLVDAYPNDTSAQYYLADLAMRSPKGFEAANAALERCLTLDPTNRYCNFDRMMLYVLEGNFEGAIELYHAQKPENQYAWFDEPFGLALYGKGDLESAREVLSNFSKETRVHGISRFTTGREWLADIDLFEGRISKATMDLEVLINSDDPYKASVHYLYLAQVNAMISRSREAQVFAFKALSKVSDDDTRIIAATILSCTQNSQESVRLLKPTDGKAIDEVASVTQYFITGCTAMGHGYYETAVRNLEAAYDIDDDLDNQFFLAKAFIEGRQWQPAIELFKSMETAKGRIIADQATPPVIWALSHYYLGKAFDGMGHTDDAIQYYSRFLDIWKNADSDLKQVLDAKQRLAILQGHR